MAHRSATTFASADAFRILYFGFILLPIAAGLDKYFHLLGPWHEYLAPVFANIIPADTFMKGVGVIEIAAGLLVAWRPAIGATVVALWLWGIILNLFLLGSHFDIALRDFGLSLGALALARLSAARDAEHAAGDIPGVKSPVREEEPAGRAF